MDDEVTGVIEITDVITGEVVHVSTPHGHSRGRQADGFEHGATADASTGEDQGGSGRTVDDLVGRFTTALARHADPRRPELAATALAAACRDVLAVDGATISVVSHGAWRLPIGASDDAAAAAERWQFAIGQDRSTGARAGGSPVAAGEAVPLADEVAVRRTWPALHDQLHRHTPFRSTTTLPLELLLHGGVQVGTLDLYSHREQPGGPSPTSALAPFDLTRARRVAPLISAGLTGASGGTGSTARSTSAARRGEREPAWMDAPTAQHRQRVWMVISMARQVLGVSDADALALLRAGAYSQDRTLEELADDVLEGRMPLRALHEPIGD